MNLIDCIVVKINSKPYEKYNRWWVDVDYDSWGHVSSGTVMVNTRAEAYEIAVGYKFSA